MRKIFKTVFCLLILFFVSGCSDDDENNYLLKCDLQTEWVKDLTDFKTKLYKDYPDNSNELSSFFVYNNEDRVFITKEGAILISCDVCNFPAPDLEQDIPDNGLDIIFSAKIHQYSGNSSIKPTIFTYYDMELTSLKISKK